MRLYKLPNGQETDDVNVYSKMWRGLAGVIEKLVPGAKLAAFDPNLTFNIDGREGQLTLSPWFVATLAQNARATDGKKFRLPPVRVNPCKMCEKPIHTSGRGRTRQFCTECIVVRAKLRGAKED